MIFALFDVASAREVPFGTPQYVQYILQGLTSVLLCVPFIFADSESVNLVVARDGFLCITKIVRMFHGGYLDNRWGTLTDVLFKQFLIRIAV